MRKRYTLTIVDVRGAVLHTETFYFHYFAVRALDALVTAPLNSGRITKGVRRGPRSRY